MKPETYEVLVLSTAHLTLSDNAALERMAKDPNENMVMQRETGYFVKLYTSSCNGFNNLSKQFNRVLRYALSIECLGIEFDRDADTLDFLETFNW